MNKQYVILTFGILALLFLVLFQNCGAELPKSKEVDGRFATLPSCRLIDTRNTTGNSQGAVFKKGLIKEDVWNVAELKGACDLPNSNVTAIAINFTLLEIEGPLSVNDGLGALAISPYSVPMPKTPTGVTAMWNETSKVVSNYTVVQINSDQKLGIFTNFQTHMIVDIVGYYHY